MGSRKAAIERLSWKSPGFSLPGTASRDAWGGEPSHMSIVRSTRLLARLDHPNVVRLFTTVQSGRLLVLVMELVEGGPLSALLRKGEPLPTGRALEIGAQVARALAYVHSLGILHRDVKPGNILIATDGQAKLTDFGLARLVTDASLTEAGQVLGTPKYMSPEQLAGGRVDSRSDLFSLGCVLFEMLSGQGAFEGDSTFESMLKIQKNERPLLKSLRPDLPGSVIDLVESCMAPKPDARPRSAEQVASKLTELAGMPKATFHVWKLRSFFWRRQKALAAFGILIVLAALAAVLFLTGTDSLREALGLRGRIPSGIQIMEQSISVQDERGRFYWSFPFDHKLDTTQYSKALMDLNRTYYRFCDLDHDGKRDLFFVARFAQDENQNSDEIFFIRHDGKVIKNIKVGRKLKRGEQEFTVNYWVSRVFFMRPAGGEERIVVVAAHRRLYPCLVWLMSLSGEILREYVHDGFFFAATPWDADGDGLEEITVGGTSNEYNCPVIAVLEPDSFGGTSPTGPRHGPWPEAAGPGRMLYYARLPNKGPDLSIEPRDSVRELFVDDNNLRAVVDHEGDLQYFFRPRMENPTAEFTERATLVYEQRRSADPSMPPVAEREKAYCGQILFWNGTDWVKEPSPVMAREEQAQ
jgi:serine/threonine protein kinase